MEDDLIIVEEDFFIINVEGNWKKIIEPVSESGEEEDLSYDNG